MRSHVPLFVALLAFAASGAAEAANSSSSGGSGASAGSGGGGHAASGGSASHGGGGAGHSALGSAFTGRGGIGAQSLDRGSFAHALGNHGAAPVTAKTAVAVRTAAAVNPHHHNHHHFHAQTFVPPRMTAILGRCTVPRFVRNEAGGARGFPCDDAFKAPINPQTGQPIG